MAKIKNPITVVQAIGSMLFNSLVDGSITSVTAADLQGSTGIRAYAFFGTTAITSVVIPSSIISIGTAAFQDCSTITSVTFEDGLTTISSYAFRRCSGLTSVSIPNSVTSIGFDAFRECTGLTSVTIPDSVTSIGDRTFKDCSNLQSVTIHATTPPVISSLTVFDNTNNCPIYVPAASLTAYQNATNWSALSSRLKPFSVGLAYTSNGDGTCYVSGIGTCTDTDIVIPRVSPDGDTVTSIGRDAFRECTGLTSVTIPDSVTSVGDGAFHGCTNLQYNTYDNAKYLGNENNPYMVLMKAANTSITSCTIHPDTKFIQETAFSECTSLTSVTIPDGVTSIGNYAFTLCTSLTSVTIGNSVTSIGDGAFRGCTTLTSVTIHATTPPTLASDNVFNNTNNCPIYVPAASVNAYKSATNWSALANRIFAIQE